MKPTEEQIKKFWEWCGITWENEGGAFVAYQDGKQILYLTNTVLKVGCWHKRTLLDELPIDLNNLFKYAVPKLPLENRVLLVMWMLYYIQDWAMGKKLDSALALFWAISKMIEEGK